MAAVGGNRISVLVLIAFFSSQAWRCDAYAYARGDVPISDDPLGPGNCGGPAEVVFILDDSRSIWNPDFIKELDFAKDLVAQFTIGPSLTRVGVVSFSEGSREEFRLSAYNTKAEIVNALGAITQFNGGRTETFLAFRMAREKTFAEARPGIPRVLIIITDGNSHERDLTIEEAAKTRQAGIEILAIGVGRDMNKTMLLEYASEKKQDHFFEVDSFPELDSIKALVSQKACKPEVAEILAECTQKPAEVALVMDRSSSIWRPDFQTQLQFLSDLIGDFDVGPTNTRVALVSFSTNATVEYHLDSYPNKQDLQDATMRINYTGGLTATQDALRLVRTSVFTDYHGFRPDASHVIVVITDGQSQKHLETREEARLLKENIDAKVFAIGVGPAVDVKELEDIASPPASNYVFLTSGYDALPAIKGALAYRACEQVVDNARRVAARDRRRDNRPPPARFTDSRLSAPVRFEDFEDRRFASLRAPSAFTARNLRRQHNNGHHGNRRHHSNNNRRHNGRRSHHSNNNGGRRHSSYQDNSWNNVNNDKRYQDNAWGGAWGGNRGYQDKWY